MGNDNEWESFQQELNDFKPGILQWEVSNLNNSVDFLDLTISISEDNYIQFKTFQKKYNLHLYVPSHSAHPPGSLKSLVYNTLATYWDQNSRHEDYHHFASLLFNRLRSRGYDNEDLTTHFRAAAKHIDTLVSENGQAIKKIQRNEIDNVRKTFFHRKFHPRDIPKTAIQETFRNNIKKTHQ